MDIRTQELTYQATFFPPIVGITATGYSTEKLSVATDLIPKKSCLLLISKYSPRQNHRHCDSQATIQIRLRKVGEDAAGRLLPLQSCPFSCGVLELALKLVG